MNNVTIYGPVETRAETGKRPYSAPRVRVYGEMRSLTAVGSKGGSEAIGAEDMVCNIDPGKRPVGCIPP